MIELPWPPRELWPNTRAHYYAKARAVKAYRTQSYWIAKSAPLILPAEGPIELLLEFRPPDNRARDLDNMVAAIKSGLDGISDAHEINDSRFRFTPSIGAVDKRGKVIIRLVEPELALAA